MKVWFDLTRAWLRSQIRNEKGQGLVEYVLIIFIVGIGLVVGLGVLQGGINGVFTRVSTTLTTR